MLFHLTDILSTHQIFMVFPAIWIHLYSVRNIQDSKVANSLCSISPVMALHNIDEAIIPTCRADNNGTNLWKCLAGPVSM